MSIRPSAAALPLLASVLLGLLSCAPRSSSIAVQREELFRLGYGAGEDQIDLFQLESAAGPLKTRIAMREGIFYVANGNGAKVVRFSSFGDVLSMIYNPERSPDPILLSSGLAEGGQGRRAVQYPFRSVGELAVDSRQTVYVEDRLPAERRVYDSEARILLDYVVLRFDREGRFLDYLGQEGIGGTPFPYIVGIHTTDSDDCVVVSVSQDSWLVHWFDPRGFLRSSIRLKRDALPQPEGQEGLIASLDRIVPDHADLTLLFKVDYYKESVDAQTKARSGIEFAGSWVYRMDAAKGSIQERWEVPALEKTVKNQGTGATERYVRIPELLGLSGDRLFLITTDDDGKTALSVFDLGSRSLARYDIAISPDELFYSSLSLSPDGILSALLGTKYEAKIVWWRFDKIFGATQAEKK